MTLMEMWHGDGLLFEPIIYTGPLLNSTLDFCWIKSVESPDLKYLIRVPFCLHLPSESNTALKVPFTQEAVRAAR